MENPQLPPAVRRAAVLEAGYSAAWAALAGGVFLAGFAVELRAGNITQGFLAALPFLAGIGQLAGAYLIEARGRSRRTVALSGLVGSRLLLLAIVPAAFVLLPENPSLMLAVTLALATPAFLLHSLANVAWLGWMGDLVSDGHRGSFFARRNFAAGLVGATLTAVGGFVAARSFGVILPRETGYLLLFLLGGLFGLAAAARLARIPDVPSEAPRRSLGSFMRRLKEPLRQRGFRSFVIFHLCWMSSVYLASPFFQFYLLQDMGLDIGFVAITATVSTIMGLTSIRTWGRLCDRFGSKPVLWVTLTVAACIPGVYLFSHAGNIRVVAVVIQGISGAVWAGISLAAANLLLKLAPRADNSLYLSSFGAVTGLATATAPILSGFVSEAAKGWHVNLLGLELHHFKFMFLASLVARFASLALLAPVAEPNERRAGEVIRALGTWRTLWSISGLELLHTHFYRPLKGKLNHSKAEHPEFTSLGD